MFYLISHIFVCLLIAALLGALLGWWLRGSKSKTEVGEARRSLSAEFDSERRSLLRQIDSTKEESQAELKSLNAKLEDLRGEVKTHESTAKKAEENEAAAKARVDETESRISGLEAELEKARAAGDSSSAAAAAAKTELEGLKARAEESEKRTAKLEAELESARADGETSGEAVGEAKSQILDLRAKLDACQSGRSELESQLAAATAGGAALGLLGDVKPENPDDLKKVEGIGPKIEGLLNEDGIWTWRGLAAAAIDRLQRILDGAGPRYRIHDPGTWPTQAGLAADGKWEELEELQDRLKGGREA